MTKKLKVLMVSEASFLSSGFGTYAKEILSRLHSTGKYEIAEFACYGKVNDPKDSIIKWRYYANAVPPGDPRHEQYMSTPENQFGRWRFERVLLDFKPDVVIDVRDYWMNSYQQHTPFRPFFHWVLMPTVDSAPQQEDWIDTFLSADAIMTYSDFCRDTLAEQSNNKINYINTTSPGVSLDVFKPLPEETRKQIRLSMGIEEDAFIVGTVCRNQKRKLIPELFQAFETFVNQLHDAGHPLASKTYLHVHTSYPDAGWDIPLYLKEYEVGNKVFFTYNCKACGHYHASRFKHPQAYCPKCGNKGMSMPNVANGLDQSDLNVIYNLMDIYVQYAICEGFGMPQVEASSAGLPVASVDYSAMQDVVHKLNGYPIRVKQYFRELETKAIRVYPDNDHLVEILHEYINMPQPVKESKRFESRQNTEKHYNWDNIAKKWEAYLDKVELTGLQGQWNQPIQPISEIGPDEFSNLQGYDYVAAVAGSRFGGIPSILSSNIVTNLMQNLDYGFRIVGMQNQQFTKEDVLKNLNAFIKNNNFASNAMQNIDKLTQEDYINYANMKGQS